MKSAIDLGSLKIDTVGLELSATAYDADSHFWKVTLESVGGVKARFRGFRNGVMVCTGLTRRDRMEWHYVTTRFFKECPAIDDLLGATHGYIAADKPTRGRPHWGTDTNLFSYLNSPAKSHCYVQDGQTVWYWMGEDDPGDPQAALDHWFANVYLSCPKPDQVMDKLFGRPVSCVNPVTSEGAERWRTDYAFRVLWYGVGDLSDTTQALQVAVPGAYWRTEPTNEGPGIEIVGASAHRIVGNVSPCDAGRVIWFACKDHRILSLELEPLWGVINRGETT